MYNIDNGLKESIIRLNNILAIKYRDVLSTDKNFLRKFIQEKVGYIKRVEELNKDELSYYAKSGGILGVDGSNNRMGGAHPHFIELYQGLAISSTHRQKPIFRTDFYTPLYSEEDDKLSEAAIDDEAIRKSKLSAIEVGAALDGIRQLNPRIVMMDGSLIRYSIECSKPWLELKEVCEEGDIILIGVIEDIKTAIIGKLLLEDGALGIEGSLYDRELLYGLLKYGETIFVGEGMTGKSAEGFSTLFMRSSMAPSVIGVDILDSQEEHLEEIARLLLSLTPEKGRGIPLWIDIVDREVRIPNKMLKGLLEEYLDRDILEMFFMSQRDKRTF